MIMYKKARLAHRAGLAFFAGQRGQVSNQIIEDLSRIVMFNSDFFSSDQKRAYTS